MTKEIKSEYISSRDGNRSKFTEADLVLDEDEYINGVVVKSGDIIDGMVLITNKEKWIESPGTGGGWHYYKAPLGTQFFSIEGNYSYNDNVWSCVQKMSLYFENKK